MTYTEEARSDAPYQPPWGLKQKDTFMEFTPCRDWYLNSFLPGEVNRQRTQTHDGLYHAYIVGEANTHAANHQIVREWRTMVREWGDWEKYREHLVKQLLSKERAEWKEVCKKDNQCMYAARSKITDLEAQISILSKKIEDAEANKEHVEIDLEAEKVKAAIAKEAKQRVEEARDISTSTLNIAQQNYAEA
ncbi:hypothetical protein Hanom_Chr02g00116521 [Helianthus anomalus]